MKKSLLFVPLFAAAFLFSVSVAAQSNAAATEDVAYELPALVSVKTVPLFDQAFENMPGVKITMYCYSLNLVVFSVDRDAVKDNQVIEQRIHSIFNTDNNSLRLEPVQSFKKANYTVMCNEQDLIAR